jgi:glycosyltransferase involved in cell wall biosynthesis
MIPGMNEARVDVTVICPFYNEAGILEQAVRALLQRLSTLDRAWELIIVNDGSRDGSADIARRLLADDPHLRFLEYPVNRGRGHALRTGIAAARGEVIVTTEIDLSWGEDIVHELVQAMDRWPEADVVVASPNLPGGAYRNVPAKRVFISKFGNRVIRMFMGDRVTMNTGMTRAYRRAAIQSLPVTEDGKEFHLEVILKANAFGYRIREIPAILEWKEYKLSGQRVERKSSSRVGKLMISHSLFSLFANPVHYVWTMALVSLALGFISLAGAVVAMIVHKVSAYLALLSVSLVVLGIVLFVMGVVVRQGNMVQRELWILQRAQLTAGPGMLTAEQKSALESEARAEPSQPTLTDPRRTVKSPRSHG